MITHIEKRGTKTKQRLVEAALVLFVEKGIAATTTRDIAQAAEVAEGTIYRHFESKEALATEIFIEAFSPYSKFLARVEKGEGTLIEKIEASASQFYRLFDENPLLWIYVMTYQTGEASKAPAGTATPYSVLLSLLKKAAKTGEIKNFDPVLGVHILLGMIEQPAVGVVYRELKAPLSPRLPDIMLAIRRVLSL
ncbi:MAG: TetR family transcriptional regulator [Parvibaculum sp.]|nr:TetR family transcriptional regulator [Parvibaculum sp.]|tara:strand:+ start:3353 stop:3934 length:582 start_codon:yes stop_codon:yes gene_type:complete